MDRRTKRKLIVLAVLLLLLALLGYGLYYFLKTRRLPIPAVQGFEQTMPPEYLFSFSGSGANALSRPIGIGVSRDGLIYVADFGNHVVRVFDRQGRYKSSFGTIKDGAHTQMVAPLHLAVSAAGEVLVTDRERHAAYVFDRSGKFLRKFTPQGKPAFAWSPLAVTFDATGNAFFTDVYLTGRHQVLYFDKQGKQTARFGKTVQVMRANEEPGGFFFPNGIAVSSGGLVFIADGDNRRVQVFDGKGEFRYVIETQGVPRGVAIDDKDRLYVVNAVAHQVDVYDLKGKQIVQFGSSGYGPGQFRYPNDVALDSSGRIYVTDRENDQVQVWAWPTEGPPLPSIPSKPSQWALCLSPLSLLLLPFAFRKRRVVVTRDFVDAMVTAEKVQEMVRRRLRWVCPEEEHEVYAGWVVDDVDLGELIRGEPHSPSDVEDLMGRLAVTEEQAVFLTMAQRAWAFCTEDLELARLAAALGIDVYDRARYLDELTGARK